MGQKCTIPAQKFTWEEVSRHATAASCWVVADGLVFDVTDFIPLHPAGAKSILMRAGQDATRDFLFHSAKSRKAIWMKYCIGTIVKPPECGGLLRVLCPDDSVLDAFLPMTKSTTLPTTINATILLTA